MVASMIHRFELDLDRSSLPDEVDTVRKTEMDATILASGTFQQRCFYFMKIPLRITADTKKPSNPDCCPRQPMLKRHPFNSIFSRHEAGDSLTAQCDKEIEKPCILPDRPHMRGTSGEHEICFETTFIHSHIQTRLIIPKLPNFHWLSRMSLGRAWLDGRFPHVFQHLI